MSWLVIGHYRPTDDEDPPSGLLDEDVTIDVFETEAEADEELLWYPDGIKRELDPESPGLTR